MKYRNLLLSIIVLVCIAFIGYYIYDYYKIPDAPEGNRVSEIVAPGVDGVPVSLSSLKGNIVLIDFWASWCGPCRVESPAWVKLYRDYHGSKFRDAKGFEMYSISLDLNRNSWLRAIEQDGLLWTHHVSDLKGWENSVAQQFGIRSIPANILIDQQGIILGANLTPAEVRNKLEEEAE